MPLPATYREKEVLIQLTQKEKAGFDFIYNLLYEKLLLYARKFVLRETARDILSETFIKLWRRGDAFESMAEVEHWLRVTLRNACIDFLRKKTVTEGHEKEYQHMSEKEYEDLYFRTSVEAELLGRIAKEIENLPPLTANIIKLSFLEGLSVDEIANRLNIQKQVVYNKKSLGIKALRLSLTDNELALAIALVSSMLTSHYLA